MDGEDEDAIVCMAMDLFEMTSEHYVRISLAEGIHSFKEKIPKKKKQALRSKAQAISDPTSGKRRRVEASASDQPSEPQPQSSGADVDVYPCKVCAQPCSEEPETIEHDRIACESCNQWHHFKCVGLKGDERFLKRKSSKWKCPACSSKGKGKRKEEGKEENEGYRSFIRNVTIVTLINVQIASFVAISYMEERFWSVRIVTLIVVRIASFVAISYISRKNDF